MACNFVPFLSGLDVLSGSENAYSIVMLGDSTFCNDAFIHLAERIITAGHHDISVINKSISGNKLLSAGGGLIGNFGEQFEQIRGFVSQMTDHMRFKLRNRHSKSYRRHGRTENIF